MGALCAEVGSYILGSVRSVLGSGLGWVISLPIADRYAYPYLFRYADYVFFLPSFV